MPNTFRGRRALTHAYARIDLDATGLWKRMAGLRPMARAAALRPSNEPPSVQYGGLDFPLWSDPAT